MKKLYITAIILFASLLLAWVNVQASEKKDAESMPHKENAMTLKELPKKETLTDTEEIDDGIAREREKTLTVFVNALEQRKKQLEVELQNAEQTEINKEVLEIELGFVKEQLSGWKSELDFLKEGK